MKLHSPIEKSVDVMGEDAKSFDWMNELNLVAWGQRWNTLGTFSFLLLLDFHSAIMASTALTYSHCNWLVVLSITLSLFCRKFMMSFSMECTMGYEHLKNVHNKWIFDINLWGQRLGIFDFIVRPKNAKMPKNKKVQRYKWGELGLGGIQWVESCHWKGGDSVSRRRVSKGGRQGFEQK